MIDHHDASASARASAEPDTEILLVDDDKIALMISERFLLKSGMSADIQKFLNGEEALEHLLHHNNAKHCLVFLDINMPVMNGWEFLECINDIEQLRAVNVVILTSSVDVADIQRSSQYTQVMKYIEKPVSVDTFLQLRDIPELQEFFAAVSG